MNLEQSFANQQLGNGYELIDGVQMHAESGDRFQIPPEPFKKNVDAGHLVELRIDSPRFSAHADAPEQCTCPHCNEVATNPILCHEQPASLVDIPHQSVPVRGWGEQFWARVQQRSGDYLVGIVDNELYEARLHGLRTGDPIFFHENHILAVHSIHNEEIILRMDDDDLRAFGKWLENNGPNY